MRAADVAASFGEAKDWWHDYDTLVGLPVVHASGGPQMTVVGETRRNGEAPQLVVEYWSRHWKTRQRFTIDARCVRLL